MMAHNKDLILVRLFRLINILQFPQQLSSLLHAQWLLLLRAQAQ